ncbi:MAG: hypothetical protein ACO258_11335 [Burkholderiaceae bacterium]|jgi:hypothetical protein
MKRILSIRPALSAVAAAALLAACGGGGGGDAPAVQNVTGTGVPVSATTSATEATKFVQGVANQNQDQAEPIAVEGATLATSETAEPEPV